jgi:hypothetical protein
MSTKKTETKKTETKKTPWVRVGLPALNPKKRYVVRVSDNDEWDDDWVVVEYINKNWRAKCSCDVNVPLNNVTHFLELPE